MPPSTRFVAGIALAISLTLLTACARTTSSANDAENTASSSSTETTTGPAAKLRAARASNTAEAYRGVLNEFPNTSEAETARQELGAMYDRALSDFIAQAPAGRAQMTQFVTKLTEYQKRTGNNVFEIRYLEREAKEGSFYGYTPSEKTREKILKAFRSGFRAFSPALIDIKDGTDISGPEDLRDIQKPTIYIEYIEWMNNTEFRSRNSKESMFGYDITLKSSLRIPEETQKFDFSVMGRTPSKFDASDIYTAVVDLAVDQFLDKIEKTFNQLD